jgi:hypothetical protein
VIYLICDRRSPQLMRDALGSYNMSIGDPSRLYRGVKLSMHVESEGRIAPKEQGAFEYEFTADHCGQFVSDSRSIRCKRRPLASVRPTPPSHIRYLDQPAF